MKNCFRVSGVCVLRRSCSLKTFDLSLKSSDSAWIWGTRSRNFDQTNWKLNQKFQWQRLKVQTSKSSQKLQFQTQINVLEEILIKSDFAIGRTRDVWRLNSSGRWTAVWKLNVQRLAVWVVSLRSSRGLVKASLSYWKAIGNRLCEAFIWFMGFVTWWCHLRPFSF